MLAALILYFARTSRLAIVSSLTTNAAATSPGVESGDQSQCQCYLVPTRRAGWQQVKMSRSWSSGSGVASARERLLRTGRDSDGAPFGGGLLDELAAAAAPAQHIDGAVAGGGEDPCARVVWHPVDRPAGHGGRVRVLDRILREGEAPKMRVRVATACPWPSRNTRSTSSTHSPPY